MKTKLLSLLLLLCLVLSGCGWMDGSYVHIIQHQEESPVAQEGSVTVSSFGQLQDELIRMVENGISKNVIFVSNYARSHAETGIQNLSRKLVTEHPLVAYAAEEIRYEVGTNNGRPAIAVEILYRHSPTEIRQVRRFQDISTAQRAVGDALEDVRPGIVMLVQQFEDVDFSQVVNDFAQANPQSVMETPQVTEAVYGTGQARLVELSFSYQNSRDSLRQMQRQVEPVFEAAKLYVSETAPAYQKYSQLFSFLMERFDYRIQSSITPSYSLLHHGVGDSRAFAVIYAAMCKSVDLPCEILTGTRDGEPWTWNVITHSGKLVHLDLLRCSELGSFHTYAPDEMDGYVWDYSALPKAAPAVRVQESTKEIN